VLDGSYLEIGLPRSCLISVVVQVLGLAAGTGGAGALAYGLTVVLPTTIEDLLALTVCSLLG
jgi:hypothetical protein